MKRFRYLLPLAILAVVYAAIALAVTNSYYQLMMTLVLVWASFGLAWNLFSGYTGLISFGHPVFFGLGAYLTALGRFISISRHGCSSRLPRCSAPRPGSSSAR